MGGVKPVVALGAIGLVALAFAVARTEPGEDALTQPFATHVEPGERGEGRNVVAVVDGWQLADRVTLRSWTGETTGVWLVVDTRMGTVTRGKLAYAELRVGDRLWTPSLRAGLGSMQSTSLDAGLPMAGSFVFELPAELLEDPDAARAVLRLSTDSDPRMDSVVELELDLATLPREAEHEVAPSERTRW